ncbi:hypothetical protein RhiirA4_428367 [Rhizophagus irregularis]|uniref:Uncharacterized protein n=1 Tax=Rhizophagus irregularis TaxID=588596 RepID=A0A2I1HCI7_9GLOM|nr:hypothetical protein RhiirA4_428367 [Rhizophagus irregularis]
MALNWEMTVFYCVMIIKKFFVIYSEPLYKTYKQKCDTGGIKEEREEETVIIGDVVNQIKPCTNCTIGHRPELGEHRWYSLKALLDWADNLGRCKKFHSLTRESDNERNTEEEEKKNTDDLRSSDKMDISSKNTVISKQIMCWVLQNNVNNVSYVYFFFLRGFTNTTDTTITFNQFQQGLEEY